MPSGAISQRFILQTFTVILVVITMGRHPFGQTTWHSNGNRQMDILGTQLMPFQSTNGPEPDEHPVAMAVRIAASTELPFLDTNLILKANQNSESATLPTPYHHEFTSTTTMRTRTTSSSPSATSLSPKMTKARTKSATGSAVVGPAKLSKIALQVAEEAAAATATVPITAHRAHLGLQPKLEATNGAARRQKGAGAGAVLAPRAETFKAIVPKLKAQKTDAPMLNYIFDSFSTANKHHHHDQRYGPHFEDIQRDGNITNITIQAGSNIYLNCRISLLQDKTVSWVKRNSNGEGGLELLTVGMHTYSGDNRYTIEFQYPNNWKLKVSNARKSDEGTYECQISTHPPRVIQVNLHINDPKVMIIDEYGAPLQEKYYEIDSTLQLSCIVRNVAMSSSVVYWSHGDDILNYDTTRGGVSVKTDLMENAANSTLFIAKITKTDSGNYTCSINSLHEYTIVVHILKGESFAELHHGNSSSIPQPTAEQLLPKLCTLVYVLLYFYTSKLFSIR